MNDPKGSDWRKWDLHVHTPDSLIHNYSSKGRDAWSDFIKDIESLPPEIKVIGVNDYIFLDGYKRIVAEKERGRLQNIDLFLPVIELRLDKFGGTDGHLSRVNFHVIFSDEVSPDVIEQQFINAISSAYKLSSEYKGTQIKWGGVPTRASLQDLGEKIINSAPESERHRYSSPLREGFNNLNVSLEKIQTILSGPYFERLFVTAVGKTEWWNIKWNDKSIADKKDIIHSANFVFIASESTEDYRKAKQSLTAAKVNDLLLDCSDAHWPSTSEEKERLGNCSTWIKADPTFEGLRQVLIEPDERIFVGEKPPQLIAVENNKTKYMKSVWIKKVHVKGKKLEEKWFDTKIQFNNGLVAIIGNKGSGKSALSDIIGLLGNSRSSSAFSFLNLEKFKKPPENRARHFEAEILWESDEISKKNLGDDSAPEEVERIKYIPQDYFEEICTQLGGIEESDFDKELKKVIFSHVGELERLEKNDLDDLIRYKSNEIDEIIKRSRLSLSKLNKDIFSLEQMLTPEYQETLKNQLTSKQAELDAATKAKPTKVKKPTKKERLGTDALKKAHAAQKALETDIAATKDRLRDVTGSIAKLEKLTRKLDGLEEQSHSFREEISELMDGLEIDLDKVYKIEVDREPINTLSKAFLSEKVNLTKLLDANYSKSLISQLQSIKNDINGLRNQLDKPNKEYQRYTEELSKWEKRVDEIKGSPKKLGTIEHLETQIENIRKIPDRLSRLYERRRSTARTIHKHIRKQRDILAEFYTPVQEFISEHPDIGEKIDLNFGTSIMNVGFDDEFLSWINLSKSGPFTGQADAAKLLSEIQNQYDFNNEKDAIEFAERMFDLLHKGRANDQNSTPQIARQLRKGKTAETLYDFIYSFEYLQARYVLKLGEKELKQLSPGERGALLIVFYLLVDLDTIPLVIDQPEHNLDNETVTKLLVPAVKKAKTRRQIVIVTHNPILAVVCNADQVIAAQLDIKDGYRVKYESGSIENKQMNKKIVDILEGTIYSFDNRQRKYIREYLSQLR